MPYISKQVQEIPDLDLISAIFDSEYGRAKEETILFADAADPARCISKAQASSASGAGKAVVSVLTSPHAFAPVIFHSILAAGGVFASIKTEWQVKDIAQTITGCSSQLIICSVDKLGLATKSAEACGLPSDNILVFDMHGDGASQTKNCFSLKRLCDLSGCMSSDRLEIKRVQDRRELENRLALLLYTSGTTGIMLSHRNLVAMALGTRKMQDALTPRRLNFAPMSFMGSISSAYLYAPIAGGTTFFMQGNDLAGISDNILKYQVSVKAGSPHWWLTLSKSPDLETLLRPFRVLISGGGPLGRDTQKAIGSKASPGVYLENSWGMTEAGPVTFPLENSVNTTGSIGPLIPNCSLRIIDDDERDVSPGKLGEIIINGPTITMGILQQPFSIRPSSDIGRLVTRLYMKGKEPK